MKSLDEWLAFAPTLERLYREELGRSCFSDPGAFVNWCYHWREDDRDEAWVRSMIQTSDEWRQKHGGQPPAPVPTPSPSPSGWLRTPIKVTDERDGELIPREYSYWSKAWVKGDSAIVFVGVQGSRPKFFQVSMKTGAVERLGELLKYDGTSEGWYFNATGSVYLIAGACLRLVDPFGPSDEVVVDVSTTRPGCVPWQPHSSDDGRTHSMTIAQVVSEGSYPKIGTMVQHDGVRTFVPAEGDLDESALAGSYLVVKSKRLEKDVDNCVVPIGRPQDAWWILDSQRALGHSDCGDGYMVGEADKPDPGECGIWDLRERTYRALFQTTNMGYVAVRGRRILWSNDRQLVDVDFLSGLQTSLVDHGNVNPSGAYDDRVKANVDLSDRVACYMSNAAGRRDIYLLALEG